MGAEVEGGGGDEELGRLMAKLEDAAWFARVGGRDSGTGTGTGTGTDESATAEAIRTAGWSAIEGAVDREEAGRLVEVIEALGREGIPPLFVYVLDATWAVGARIARAISAAIGVEYVVLADAWAFRVAPGPGNAGWAPHRGSYEVALDRAAPDLLNVWVALTDATVDNACMHVVPLDDDPAYPAHLRSHDAADRAIPLPVPAGTALVWNANVLHSGGRSTERAKAPRISITFTLRRADCTSPSACTTPAVDLGPRDHRAHLDLLADQILAYGELDPTLPDVVRRWANLSVSLRKGFPFGGPSGPRKAP